MKKFNQLWYTFRTRDGREEFHVSSDKEDVKKFDALSSSIPMDSEYHAEWKREKLAEIKVFGMKEVFGMEVKQ